MSKRIEPYPGVFRSTANGRVYINVYDGCEIKTSQINFDDRGDICKITDTDGNEYLQGQFNEITNLIEIPGLGFITQGTRLIYKDKAYALDYGWHTNISNQTIMSWYLVPLEEEGPPKTLYQSMVNEINLYRFR